MLNRVLFFFAGWMICSLPAAADVVVGDAGHDRVPYELGGRLLLGMPAGDFGEKVDNEGVGLGAHAAVRVTPNISFGIGGEAMIYGSDSRTYSLPLVEDFDLTTNNNLAGGYLFMQARAGSGVVQPYVEGRVGLRYLWTDSRLEDRDFFDDEEIARETNHDDIAGYVGGGGGILFRVKRGDPATKSPSIFIDSKVTHVQGAVAEFLDEGDVTFDENDVPILHVSEGETDLTSVEFGLVFAF